MKYFKHLPLTHYFLHHAVTIQESLTTDVRLVFDKSAYKSYEKSPRYTLEIGPVFQLSQILIGFRLNNIAVKAAMAEMYRQVLIDGEDATLD